jgi:hypothetical protein
MASRFRLKKYRWIGGEHYCYLEDLSSGLPHQYSLLYVTTKVRNAGLSLSAMEAALKAINVLYLHFLENKVDIEERFKRGEYLDPHECEQLRRAAQRHLGREPASEPNVHHMGLRKRKQRVVQASSAYIRLTEMARYLHWLGHDVGGRLLSPGRVVEIERMCENIRVLRPATGNKSSDPPSSEWTVVDSLLLTEIMEPGSPRNPFQDSAVQLRNRVLIELLRLTGKRRGEVLNLRLGDIDFRRCQISIVRRPDAKEDNRADPPRVKTQAHTIPVTPELIDLLRAYLPVRRAVPGATKHPYFLVTHKSGPTQGQPMTKGALNVVIREIKTAEPRLAHLHPHILRHHFNEELSRVQDAQTGDRNFDEEAKVRNHLNGWSQDSKMGHEVYARRHIIKKSMAIGLEAQANLQRGSGLGRQAGGETREEDRE